MMRRMSYGFYALLVSFFMLTGCATVKPVDLSPPLTSKPLIQKVDNLVVLFDKSASMSQPYGKDNQSRVVLAKNVTSNMIAAIPEIKLNTGLRTFWGEDTALVYGMKPLAKADYAKAVNGIGFPYSKTPLEKAIDAAGSDLRGAAGGSAIVIVSDFSDEPGIDDLNIEAVMEAAAKVSKEYGDKLCVYTIQVGNVPGGKELAEQLVQSVRCGDAVNADDLATPAAMAAFVDKIISGKGSLHGVAVTKPTGEGAISDAEAKAAAAEKARAAALARERELAEANRLSGRTDLEHIRFDFDKSVLRPKDREVLKKHAAMLKKEKDTTIIVEGHCDEIGTTEYNLALGQRRAAEVMKYLVASGVDEKRIKTISYGKEKPLDLGHTEEARAKNRRAQFIVKPN